MTFSPKGGFVSTDNSTAATLAGGAVFTGVGEDCSSYASVSVSWNADVASADGGLSMQFSTDNTNWDRKVVVDSHSDTLQVNHGGVHRLSVVAQYFRIVYTNGSGAQSFFRLQTLFHTDNSMGLISRIEQQQSITSDCMITRPITVPNLDLARRQITGQRTFFFFGFNDDVDSAWEDITPQGGDINWLTGGTIVEILSSDAADTSAGLGVRSVELHGLSVTGADQEEVIAMNGTTPVQSALTYCRINRLHNETVGTYGGSHQGDITCRITGGGSVLAIMTGREGSVDTSVQYGTGESNLGCITVPLGKVLYVTGLEVTPNVKSNQTVSVVLYEREGILNTSAPMDPRRLLWSEIEVNSRVGAAFGSYMKIKQLTDLWFRAQASGSNSKISCALEFYLLDQNADGE